MNALIAQLLAFLAGLGLGFCALVYNEWDEERSCIATHGHGQLAMRGVEVCPIHIHKEN